MNTIFNEHFLLQSEEAKLLYHDYAKNQPILDFHCHLSPEQLAKNINFKNLTEIWLNGDHYKWRAMRAFGVDEAYITGDADDKDKFRKWAETVPYTVRNPLFHWSHLELQRYFEIDDYLNLDTADAIYSECSEMLGEERFSTQQIPIQLNVKVMCTTDDPLDTLEYHKKLNLDGYSVSVLPTFRPDNILKIENPVSFIDYLQRLGQLCGMSIESLDDLLNALATRVEYFNSNGCRLSDHGLDYIYFTNHDYKNIERTFQKVLNNQKPGPEEVEGYKAFILVELGKLYHKYDWVQQFHLGALRNTNKRLLKKLGPDSGADSIGSFNHAQNISEFLNGLDEQAKLAKTILYNLNPADNDVFATMTGNFQGDNVRGKLQFGSAWWFLDQKEGIEKQINSLSNMGLLSQFVGMVTDSRSFMSFPRHEYFRRILCNIIGEDIRKGELPNDMRWLGNIVEDICFHNANNYFGFNQVQEGSTDG